MKPASRGIDPETLLGHVHNTVPFLFADRRPLTPYTETVLSYLPGSRLSHFDYFALCLGCHYTTVASFVPTDVDNQIRKHLWEAPVDETERMAELVLSSRNWDFRPLTARFQEAKGRAVSGHNGEWFSVAVGAYAAHRESRPELAEAVIAAIEEELQGEAQIFLALEKAKDGLGLLRASTAIAHNLGDLDRVIDQWELAPNDPLRQRVYKLGHSPKAQGFQPPLLAAGALNKAFMASENHRHYPLRSPKCLRRSLDLFLPLGPFFDSWGETVALHPLLSREEVAEVALALLEGFQRLSSPKVPLYGYARALGSLQAAFPGGPARLYDYLPAKAGKLLQKGLIPEIHRPGRSLFEAQWAKKALHFLKIL